MITPPIVRTVHVHSTWPDSTNIDMIAPSATLSKILFHSIQYTILVLAVMANSFQCPLVHPTQCETRTNAICGHVRSEGSQMQIFVGCLMRLLCPVELATNLHEDFTITVKALTTHTAFFWLKALSHLRHYNTQLALTHGKYKGNSTSTIKIGQAKTGWGAA